MNKSKKQMMIREIQFILESNDLAHYQKDIEDLINRQGVEVVFNNLYHIFCSNGNFVSKRNKIMTIIKERSESDCESNYL